MDNKALCNIVRVEIETDENEANKYVFETASEATYAPVNSEGAETVLRVKNTILATNKTEDIQYGSDITFVDTIFMPEVFALVDGGTLKGSKGNYTGYDAPVVGSAVSRKKFKLNIYTEEKDTDGETLGYVKFGFKGCKGTPATFNFKDGEFLAPSYTISSRPPKGQAPYSIDFLSQLPEIS